jgi:hypothetical protein
MGAKDIDRKEVEEEFPAPLFIRRIRNMKGDRKSAIKVQLSHAMDQIASDVKQAVEVYAKEVMTTGLTGE